jgi:YVTN family beta-propeller protein
MMRFQTPALLLAAALSFTAARAATPLPTGDHITPVGTHTNVGNFPVNMALSPDGKYVVVTNVGTRQYLTVLDAKTGKRVSQVDFNGPRSETDKATQALYVGLAFGPWKAGQDATLYVARGIEDEVSVQTLFWVGRLTTAGPAIQNKPLKGRPTLSPSGIALSGDGGTLYAANNDTTGGNDPRSYLSVLNTKTGKRDALIEVPAYPLAVAVCTRGPGANNKVYVSSERDGLVTDIDPVNNKIRRQTKTGDHPMALLLDKGQRRLFVANAGSDTVSIVSAGTDKVLSTILLRPVAARGLPGATPTGLALNSDETRLYVSLADMNAVAVVDLAAKEPKVIGYIPAGWYPTSVLVAPDGKHLFVSNARGRQVRNPNDAPAGPDGAWGQYVLSVLEGTVSRAAIPSAAQLKTYTEQVLVNNRVASAKPGKTPVDDIPIQHVIYIIQENRTYDQVLGDVKRGNGDPSITMFGEKVTPNHHAFVDRFALLDNFYCCAEVSGTGWNWSTSGMANEYTQRTVASSYGGRGRTYDWEATNHGTPVDLVGLPDVATAPGGYLWDNAINNGVSFRNYGCFVGEGPRTPEDTAAPDDRNQARRKSLEDFTNRDFRQFDMRYADSDAWVKIDAPSQVELQKYGSHDDPSRYTAWKRDFDGWVENGDMPRFQMIRLGRDHTSGTRPGVASPQAMVADNDYAVGEIVDAVSHSRFWKSAAIFIVEDDAQNGHDHVDCHRSPGYVVSPFVKTSVLDSRFYNTDSMLRTMEVILGLPPMNRYDATAPVLDIWTKTPDNDAPYDAILPDEAILRQVNTATAYRAQDSVALNFEVADSVPDQVLNDILWHAVKGVNTPQPKILNSVLTVPGAEVDDDD